MWNPKRSSSAFTFIVAIVVACTGAHAAPAAEGPAYAPQLHPGDKWTYRVVQGYRQKTTWTETHEVKSVVPGTVTMTVTAEGPQGRISREEVWSAPGVVRSGANCRIRYQALRARADPLSIPDDEPCNVVAAAPRCRQARGTVWRHQLQGERRRTRDGIHTGGQVRHAQDSLRLPVKRVALAS